eukprot:CAMPEP_0175015500 /NCGR_PEP_ID=MMETSP0005-20121125/11215_1 /TAXON_ID=420556 /ORGANISM="Ochromonas sp., Strain CCMP1393" /LENGTH=201 /DNA_ID=CAMNT_0016272487 /DNA_START=973 /DNA_END=1579 /DNA_ORIENTATION=-
MHDYTGSYGVATAIDIDIEQKSDYMDSNLSTRVPSRPPKRKIQECKDRDPEDENDELLRHINDEASSRSQTKNQECKEAAIDDSEGGKVINGEALIHHPAQVLLPAERQNTPPQRSILRQLMHDLWEAISPIPQQTDSNVDDSADDSEFDLSLADPNDGNASTGTAHSDGTNKATDNSLAISSSAGSSSSLAYSTYSNAYF